MVTQAHTTRTPQRVTRPPEPEVAEELLDHIPEGSDGGDEGQDIRKGRMSSYGGDERLTRFGTPDRRFKGQRDLPPPNLINNPNYRRARRGGALADGTPITLSGAPDRRFKENRGKSDEQIRAEWADQVYATWGSGR